MDQRTTNAARLGIGGNMNIYQEAQRARDAHDRLLLFALLAVCVLAFFGLTWSHTERTTADGHTRKTCAAACVIDGIQYGSVRGPTACWCKMNERRAPMPRR